MLYGVPYFQLTVDHMPYHLLLHLCALRQAMILTQSHQHRHDHREETDYRTKILFKLDKICRDLNLSVSPQVRFDAYTHFTCPSHLLTAHYVGGIASDSRHDQQ